ncbi:hypothetical protein ACIGO6_22600 [Streptomyces sp. NPDC053750]|uniref:hypothetical protein n=1 Tax=Streptomyces sp. NPDC053750 TaxID=3365714 RepID=UPI0037D8F7D0
MVWSAVLPGAAPRVMRRAAGRRALHVALLVGGLFVLGVLCGERAQAAEGAPGVRDVVGRVVDSAVTVEGPESSVPQDSRGAVPAAGAVLPELRPVAERAVRSVEDRVVRPVGDTVDTVARVTEGLGAVVRAEVPPLAALPPLPRPPSPPSLSSSAPLPGASGVTGVTDLTGLPGRTVPDGSAPSASPPRATASEPSTSEVTGQTDASDSPASDSPATATPASDPSVSDGVAATVAYGPDPVAAGTVPSAVQGDTRSAVPAPTGHAPVHQAPPGDPDGALDTGSGADNGTPRHCDAHAVTPQHRLPLRLVPGALVRADVTETRERYRDIPVSPA